MKVGIVGSEAAKFTEETEAKARDIIVGLLSSPGVTAMVSGGCHLGGVDIFAEEEAAVHNMFLDMNGHPPIGILVHKPASLQWSTGYKPRNLAIARDSDEVHCITLAELPRGYTGMRFPLCYHCYREDKKNYTPHVKSGGCWTMIQARRLGKPGVLHVI